MSRGNPDFALAPIPPALISSLAVLAPPPVSFSARTQAWQYLSAGFSPHLFQPPRV
jgi:hypothetical protein